MAADGGEERRRWFRREILPLERTLLNYARSLCRRGDDPADLVHETYAKIIGYAGWREIDNPRAFALRTLKNCAIDLARRRSVVAIDAVADLERVNVVDPGPSPEATALAQDELRRLASVVAGLSPQCRRVFTLRKVYDFTHLEIAERLGISVSTVEKHLVKGLKICSQAMVTGGSAPEPKSAPRWSREIARTWPK